MRQQGKTWIGADPGGSGKFGIALITDEVALAECRDSADDAIRFLKEHLGGRDVAGVGVDAPLWWSSGQAGARQADEWLRATCGFSGGEVQSMNSLRGACLVQGMMFVERIRQLYPGVAVTESHPKAVLKFLKLANNWKKTCAHFSITTECRDPDGSDAIVAALHAREAFEGRWTHDLSRDRHDCEQDPSSYWLAPVHYFWPD